MKIFIICSTNFYDKIEPISNELNGLGHTTIMPNGYGELETEKSYDEMTHKEYLEFFKEMYNQSRNKISNVDAVLVLNFSKEKNGQILENYIGASTFLEMYEAFMQDKKIFMFHELPNNMLYDEIKGFNPIIINEDLNKILDF